MNKFFHLLVLTSFFFLGAFSQETAPPTTNGSNTEVGGSVEYQPVLKAENSSESPDGDKVKTDDDNTTESTNNSDQQERDADEEKRIGNIQDVTYYNGLPIFGNDIFRTSGPFSLSNNIPIPLNYIVGPGDALTIDVTGISLKSWNDLKVQPDNSIMIPSIGKVYVGGHTYDDAVRLIKNKLRANRFAVDNGTEVNVSLTNIRSINIKIIGEVQKKGSYTVPSLTTVFNALYRSGGITKNGSYRNVQLIRGNYIYATIDIYDYLLRGDLSSDFSLEDGDIINVPIYQKRVGISGEVKRPALYEVKSGENLRDVISFAGGFTEFAYANVVKVVQVTDKEQRLRTIDFDNIDRYIPQNGDRYTINRILDRFENRVTIQGAVFRPGEYELEVAKTLKGLILLADSLREEAYLTRGYLTRLNPVDNSMEQISFDIKGIIDGTSEDIPLTREDVVTISNLYELTDASNVRVLGKVRSPGTYSYYNGMTVEDLILMANGFTSGANYQRIEIARIAKDSDRKAENFKLMDIITISVDPYLKLSDKYFTLQPYDIVSVFPLKAHIKPATATIEGAVMMPGTYSLLRRNDRISDLIKRSQGITDWAYLKGASLMRVSRVSTHNEKELEKVKRQRQRSVIINSSDKERNEDVAVQTIQPKFITIDLSYILKHPGSSQDLMLRDGDILSIPEEMQTVKIAGEVFNPVIATYKKGKSLIDYIKTDAGGFTSLSLKKKTFVTYPNGKSSSKTFFGGFPKVEPGSEIYVPYKKPKERNNYFSLQNIIAITSSVTTTAALVIAIINSTKQ